MSAHWPRPSFYAVTLLVIALDQLAKMWATLSLRPLGSVALIPGFFNLTYVQNTGIAFGMFAGQGLLVALFVVALVLLMLIMRDQHRAIGILEDAKATAAEATQIAERTAQATPKFAAAARAAIEASDDAEKKAKGLEGIVGQARTVNTPQAWSEALVLASTATATATATSEDSTPEA